MIFKLRTKPTQFVTGKTEETLCDMMKRWEENKLINNNDDDDDNDNDIKEHLIDIIVTNNSLLETEMWKYRTINKFEQSQYIKIHILSSKSNDFTDINSYISRIQQSTDKNDLPNVLIVCYHTKRVCSDIVTLCNTFGGLHKMILPNIPKKHIIKFHISFDEPDANIGVTKKFLSKINPFIKNGSITGILFITATPVDNFWIMLNKSGIKQLLNTNKDTVHNFDDDFRNYRSFEDHNISEYNNDTNNPLYYIMDLFCKGMIDETSRKIIFAPGHLYTEEKGVGSHSEIELFFLTKGYVVLKINGKHKGFTYPDSKYESLEDYNKKYDIRGELRETLKHWSENNKLINLAITGYWVIERGVTFNTINFNFTDMILSNYHMKNLAKLIQLIGRGTGGKEYVDIMNIFCTTDIKNAIECFNSKHKQICRLNPELFNRTDFITNGNTIPVKGVIINIDLLNMLIKLKTSSKRGYKLSFHKILVEGVRNGTIILYDKNNINKFNIESRNLQNVRMFSEEDILNRYKKDKKPVHSFMEYRLKSIQSRRFKNFSDNFDNFKTNSQSCDITEYNIDFTKDKYKLDGFVNETNTFWITFRV